MKAKIFSNGGSSAIRLPKALSQRYGFGDEVELVPTEDGLLLKKVDTLGVPPASTWSELFAQAKSEGALKKTEDFGFQSTHFDKTDWTWPGV